MKKTTVEQFERGASVTITDTETGTGQTWRMEGDQIEKHMRGIEDAAHPFAKANKGELSAARDMANEATKQIES